jgi:hypothetical protein
MVLGLFKRRRNETMKRDALRIGGELMGGVNARIEQWRAERLETRREMWESAFDERIVALEPEEGLSLNDLLQIEGLSLMQTWDSGRDERVKEAMFYLTDEDVQFLEMIDGGERITQVLYEKFGEVSTVLEAHIDEAIGEELKRRGTA